MPPDLLAYLGAAAFEPGEYAIYLRDNLDLEDPADNSFPLHELVHGLQWKRGGETMYEGCERAIGTEREAYRAQNAYLKQEGRLARFGHALLLFLSCARGPSGFFAQDAKVEHKPGESLRPAPGRTRGPRLPPRMRFGLKCSPQARRRPAEGARSRQHTGHRKPTHYSSVRTGYAMGPRALSITDEIFQVGGPGLTAPEDAAAYLFAAEGRAALIDAGCGRATDLLLANIEAAGVAPSQVELLLLTHCHYDHSGGAAELRKRLGCRVVAHSLEAIFIEEGNNNVTAAAWYMGSLTPCVVDRRLSRAREEIPLGRRTLTAIHIPGHSPGSVAYLVESGGRRVLFAQDVHGPLHPALLSTPGDYLVSLQRLLDLDADVLCEGHLGVFQGREAVAAFIRSFLVGRQPDAGEAPGPLTGPV